MAYEIEHRTRTLTTKVDESTYARVLTLCDDKTPSEWLRELIEWRLDSQGDTVTLLAEVIAVRRLLLHLVVDPARPTAIETIRPARDRIDAEKVDRARALLRLPTHAAQKGGDA